MEKLEQILEKIALTAEDKEFHLTVWKSSSFSPVPEWAKTGETGDLFVYLTEECSIYLLTAQSYLSSLRQAVRKCPLTKLVLAPDEIPGMRLRPQLHGFVGKDIPDVAFALEISGNGMQIVMQYNAEDILFFITPEVLKNQIEESKKNVEIVQPVLEEPVKRKRGRQKKDVTFKEQYDLLAYCF